jgi:hypothetical protein
METTVSSRHEAYEAMRIEKELIAAHPSACNIENRRPRVLQVVRLSPSQIAAVEEWRRRQPDNPPRATAVVRLFAMALEALEKADKAAAESAKGDDGTPLNVPISGPTLLSKTDVSAWGIAVDLRKTYGDEMAGHIARSLFKLLKMMEPDHG